MSAPTVRPDAGHPDAGHPHGGRPVPAPPAGGAGGWVLWAGWLGAGAAELGLSRSIPPFGGYLLLPAIAAVCGAGIVTLLHAYQGSGTWLAWLPAAGVLASLCWAAYLAGRAPGGPSWPRPALAAGAVLAAAALLPGTTGGRRRATGPRVPRRPMAVLGPPGARRALAGAALAAVMILTWPALWAAGVPDGSGSRRVTASATGLSGSDALVVPGADGDPADLADREDPGPAPPGRVATFGGPIGTGVLDAGQRAVLDHALRYRDGAGILLATTDAARAAPFIVATSQTVVALNGLDGTQRGVPTEELARMVDQGRLRFILAGPPGPGDRTALTRTVWILGHCRRVPLGVPPARSAGDLYRCDPHRP